MSFCWLGTESSCALGGLVSPAESWGAEERHCRSGQGFGTLNFVFSLTSVGTSLRNGFFWKAPHVQCGACDGGKGALHSVTRFGVHRDYKYNPDLGLRMQPKCRQRKDGCCNSPLRQLSGFCMAIGHQGQEEAPHSCWPTLPVLSGAPAPLCAGHRRNNSQACQVGLFYFWIILYIVQYIKIQSTQKKFTVSKGSDYSLGHLYAKVPSSSIA